MARAFRIYLWKKVPFLRIVIPFIAGIVSGYYFNIAIQPAFASAVIIIILFILFSILPERLRFQYKALQGILICLFIAVTGMILTWNKDVRNQEKFYGNFVTDSSLLLVSLQEPPVEKAKTYKAIASVKGVINNDKILNTTGKVILYFAKDSIAKDLKYGDRILVKNKIGLIKNSGNPGAFDYAEYLAFQQIYFQGFLKKSDWYTLGINDSKLLPASLFTSRDYVVKTIDTYISGDNESALAKALLIGYRVDLDKDLVQAYSNAGVVHLIAISGLHLALIYGMLLLITLKIPFLKTNIIARFTVILFCLWFFSFLTGAPASVMRAAVMFSIIALGMIFNKNASIYNSLCVSAFVLLCTDPFLFWDVGFQLSYLAVLGIVILQKPIYNWFYFKNKIVNYIWKMASISIAAQIFTIPLCFYYFHQLPLLFLIANIIAIPLATVALWGCIALVIVSPVPVITIYVGRVVTAFLWMMNHSVLLINDIPFALWKDVSISVTGTILLYVIFICFIYWLINKNLQAFKTGIALTLIFTTMISFNKWNQYRQKKLIVYNVPRQSAIDFIHRGNYLYFGDTVVSANPQLTNFHLRPARISLFSNKPGYNQLSADTYPFYQFYDKRILLIDTDIKYLPLSQKINVDYLVISKNPKIKIEELSRTFNSKLIIFDASNPVWKIEQWKKECEDLHLPFHQVSEQGAFVTNF